MEKIIMSAVVFAAIALFIREIVRAFKGEDSCCSCGDAGKCEKNKECL